MIGRLLVTILGLALSSSFAAGQTAGQTAAASPMASDVPWYQRVEVELSVTEMKARRRSEFFQLFDRAFAPVSNALNPRGGRATVRVGLSPRWAFRTSLMLQNRGAATLSRNPPPGETAGQATTLDVWSWEVIGGEWQAYRRAFGPSTAARDFRLQIGAGLGVTGYRLRQVGRFVDEARQLTYADDFRSSGRGIVPQVSAAAEVAIIRQAAIRVEWRVQRGRASMNEDFAEFDRLDLGGHQLGIGLVLHPISWLGRTN